MKEKIFLVVPVEIDWDPKKRKGRRENAVDHAIDLVEESDLNGGCGGGEGSYGARLAGEIKVQVAKK